MRLVWAPPEGRTSVLIGDYLCRCANCLIEASNKGRTHSKHVDICGAASCRTKIEKKRRKLKLGGVFPQTFHWRVWLISFKSQAVKSALCIRLFHFLLKEKLEKNRCSWHDL